MTSVATPASFSRTASSIAISQNGLTAILTLVEIDAGFVRLDAHLYVGVDDAFDGTNTFIRSSDRNWEIS